MKNYKAGITTDANSSQSFRNDVDTVLNILNSNNKTSSWLNEINNGAMVEIHDAKNNPYGYDRNYALKAIDEDGNIL